jgi:hypothetical protein
MKGTFYVMTNSIYEEKNFFKIGFTQNIIERKGIHSNSSPIPFYYKVIIFSDEYELFEKEVKRKIIERGVKQGYGEWINCTFEELLDVIYDVAINVSNEGICYNKKRYVFKNNTFKETKLPNCDLKLLGIKDGTKIICKENNEEFIVKGNGILVNDDILPLSTYMNKYHPRTTKTNEHRGQQYFFYKNNLISEIWDSIFNK